MKTTSALLLLATFSLTACIPSDSGGPPLGPAELNGPDILPQQDVYSLRSFSGIDTRRGRIITDNSGFQTAWDEVFAHYAPGQKPFLPAIDFTHYVVLLASAGPTPTQLLWFRITKVRERPQHLAVLVESQWPDCGGAPVVTNPVHIVLVPRVATQAVFEFVNNGEPCS
jgi:hypothetical protein